VEHLHAPVPGEWMGEQRCEAALILRHLRQGLVGQEVAWMRQKLQMAAEIDEQQQQQPEHELRYQRRKHPVLLMLRLLLPLPVPLLLLLPLLPLPLHLGLLLPQGCQDQR
jgi:hypothetical protein